MIQSTEIFVEVSTSRPGNVFMFYMAENEVRTFQPDGADSRLNDLGGVIDIWPIRFASLQHGRDTPRRARGVIPKHSSHSPERPLTGKCA